MTTDSEGRISRAPARRALLHVDGDSFYASVAMRSRPELLEQPMAVVAHVFIASANYPARQRGIKGGMLARDAQRVYPGLVLINVDRNEVEEASDALFDLFDEVARAVEPGSLEEAFLDVGVSSWDDAIEIGHLLRGRAAAELRLPVSVGVGRTKLMAKLASRAAKPDGLHVIEPAAESELRRNLLLENAWGIGPRTVERLHTLGVRRLGDIDAFEHDHLVQQCGTAMARRLRHYRDGTDDATVRPVDARANLSAEVATSGYKRPDWTPGQMLQLCIERACRRAARAGLAATGVTVRLRVRADDSSLIFKYAGEAPTADAGRLLRGCQLRAPRPVPPLAGLRVTLTGLQPTDHSSAALF